MYSVVSTVSSRGTVPLVCIAGKLKPGINSLLLQNSSQKHLYRAQNTSGSWHFKHQCQQLLTEEIQNSRSRHAWIPQMKSK